MIASIDLAQRLTQIKSSIPEANWFYFHLESIENFICHLPGINNERTRTRTAQEIAKYLDVVEQRAKEQFDPTATYKDLSKTHIWPISHVFTDELGFIQKPQYLLFAGVAFALTYLLQLALPLLIAILTVVILSAWKLLRDRTKIRERRFY